MQAEQLYAPKRIQNAFVCIILLLLSTKEDEGQTTSVGNLRLPGFIHNELVFSGYALTYSFRTRLIA